jgi:2-polyprenyl-3-methyl-5-hydroxy-6-metoxy-1,4-benzoquinol methylase
MGRLVTRAQAQSFDKLAERYDQLCELGENRVGQRLTDLLPGSGERALDLGCGGGRHTVLLADRFAQVDAVDLAKPMIELATSRRSRPNISYWQADLHDVAGAGRYDFILSVMTLHHVPDLHAALTHIKRLLAPGGRLVVVDCYDMRPDRPSAWWRMRLALEDAVPLRLRLHALALILAGMNVVRGRPATAWRIYRLQTTPEWLDHRVSDRPFSLGVLRRSCADLFPGARPEVIGGAGTWLVWDAPAGPVGQLSA